MRLISIIGITAILTGCGGGGNPGGNNNAKGKRVFSEIAHWTNTGLINHYNTTTTCDVFNIFVVEGLYSYVRTTDEVYCQLAEAMPVHTSENLIDYRQTMGEDMYQYFSGLGFEKVNVSTCKIRENARWNNGDYVKAKDIWSYYYITHPTSTNYMITIHIVDDHTIQFVWNPQKEPVNKVKELLLSLDVSGTVHYDTFISYAEACYDVTMKWPVNTNLDLWGAFNRYPLGIGDAEIARIRDEFYACNPSWYISTGPYKLEKFSATKILLTKNEYFYNYDKLEFDEIHLYSFSDTNQVYQLISNGTLDYWDGYIVADTLDSILEKNSDVINLKMYDPGTYGLLFNLENQHLSNVNVRKALQYVFNRDEVKKAANPYASTSPYPTMGMCPTEAKMYMSESGYNNLPRFTEDWDTAEQILIGEGYSKNESGFWTKNGTVVSFTVGCPSALISQNSLQAAASQMQDFGFDVEMVVSANYLGEGEAANSKFDMCLDFNDLNMSFSHPTGSYQQFANIYSRINHLPRYAKNHPEKQKIDQVILSFPGLNGDTNSYEFADYINTFYYREGTELNYMVDVFNTGIANKFLGVQFFENVTASTFNTSRLSNLPFEDKWSATRNVTYVPTAGTEDFMTIARYNLYYSKNYCWVNGAIKAK